MKRLFPVNEPLTASHAAVLEVIAAELGCSLDAIYIGEGASGPAVFYEDVQSSNGTRCACDLSSSYWQECQAGAAVTALLARLSHESDQGSVSGKLVQVSKFLSFVLRHQREAIGLVLDADGWGNVDELLAGAARQGKQFSRELIEQVVATNDKKRFELCADNQRIRAVQGHSTRGVQRQFEPRQPPDVLFHGTASRFVTAIDREGLKPGARHYVHLSADEHTARCVGLRYGLPVVLAVDAARMHAQGFVFHQAENGVWLTARVPPAFLRRAG